MGGLESSLPWKRAGFRGAVSPFSSKETRSRIRRPARDQGASLESPRSAAHNPHVSTKQIVRALRQKLPEDVSLHEVAQETEFVAAGRQGSAEIDRGERIPIEEIERDE